jgi:hypothetical protein
MPQRGPRHKQVGGEPVLSILCAKPGVAVAAMATGHHRLPSLSFAADPRWVPIDLNRLIATRLLIQASSGGGKSWTLRCLPCVGGGVRVGLHRLDRAGGVQVVHTP